MAIIHRPAGAKIYARTNGFDSFSRPIVVSAPPSNMVLCMFYVGAIRRLLGLRLEHPRHVLAPLVGLLGGAGWLATSFALTNRTTIGVHGLIAGLVAATWFAGAWLLVSHFVRLRSSLIRATLYAVVFPYATISATAIMLWYLPVIVVFAWWIWLIAGALMAAAQLILESNLTRSASPGPSCPACGYSLVGLDDQPCPECGTPQRDDGT